MRPGGLNQSWPREKMLGIANPSLVSVDELKRSTSFNRGKVNHKIDCR